jgi:hypothetical protein
MFLQLAVNFRTKLWVFVDKSKILIIIFCRWQKIELIFSILNTFIFSKQMSYLMLSAFDVQNDNDRHWRRGHRRAISEVRRMTEQINHTSYLRYSTMIQTPETMSFTTLLKRMGYDRDPTNVDCIATFVEIMNRLRADPTINPNKRNPDILELCRIYGNKSDFFYLIEMPYFELDHYQFARWLRRFDILLANPGRRLRSNYVNFEITPDDIQTFVLKIRHHGLKFVSTINLDYFGFLSLPQIRTQDYLLLEQSKKLTCTVCLTPIKKNSFGIPYKQTHLCYMHPTCALHFVFSFVEALENPNPLEQKLLNYPCQIPEIPETALEVRPSFINFVHDYFCQNGLEFLMGLKKPKEFLKRYGVQLQKFTKISLSDLNHRVALVMFRSDDRFVPCSGADCGGFALVPPDQEVSSTCGQCQKLQTYVGSKLRQERSGDLNVAIKTIAENSNIRACPTCGKLIERTEGCPRMVCPAGHVFDWHRSEPKHTENLHF